MDEMRVFDAAVEDEEGGLLEFGVNIKAGPGREARIETFSVELPVPGPAFSKMARAYNNQTLAMKNAAKLPTDQRAEAMGPIGAATAVALDDFLSDVLGAEQFTRFQEAAMLARLPQKGVMAVVRMIMSDSAGAPFTQSSSQSPQPPGGGERLKPDPSSDTGFFPPPG